MATNHTTNYNLNLWEANDNFVREEFNENTSKIDAAIKAEADARAAAVTAETTARTAADSAINTTLAQKARFVTGTYTGNNQASRFISTGFTPKAVLVATEEGDIRAETTFYGGLAVTGRPAGNWSDTSQHIVEIVSGGFNVFSGTVGRAYIRSNYPPYVYNYIAFA